MPIIRFLTVHLRRPARALGPCSRSALLRCASPPAPSAGGGRQDPGPFIQPAAGGRGFEGRAGCVDVLRQLRMQAPLDSLSGCVQSGLWECWKPQQTSVQGRVHSGGACWQSWQMKFRVDFRGNTGESGVEHRTGFSAACLIALSGSLTGV